jgi:hypothetical protein
MRKLAILILLLMPAFGFGQAKTILDLPVALPADSIDDEAKIYFGVGVDTGAATLPKDSYKYNIEQLRRTISTAVDTTSDLAALSPRDGQLIWVKGRVTVDDGGGGIFRYVAADVNTPDSGIYFAEPQDGGNYVRLRNETGRFSIMWYGAAHDATVDCTTAIQAATDAATIYSNINGAAVVYIPGFGTGYRVTDTIDPGTGGSGVSFEGDVHRASNLVWDPTTGGTAATHAGLKPLLNFANSGSNKINNNTIRNLYISIPVANTQDFLSAISVRLGSRTIISDVIIQMNAETLDRVGVVINGQEQIRFHRSRITAPMGILVSANLDSSSFRDLYLQSDSAPSTLPRNAIHHEQDGAGFANVSATHYDTITAAKFDRLISISDTDASKGAIFTNVRIEQGTNAAAYQVDLNSAADRYIFNLLTIGGVGHGVRLNGPNHCLINGLLSTVTGTQELIRIDGGTHVSWSGSILLNTNVLVFPGGDIQNFSSNGSQFSSAELKLDVADVANPKIVRYQHFYKLLGTTSVVDIVPSNGTLREGFTCRFELPSGKTVQDGSSIALIGDQNVTGPGILTLTRRGSVWIEQAWQPETAYPFAQVARTIATDVFALPARTQRYGKEIWTINVTPQGGAPDDLISITGAREGDIVILRNATSNAITLKHNTGSSPKFFNDTKVDLILTAPQDSATYVRAPNDWIMIGALSDNG